MAVSKQKNTTFSAYDELMKDYTDYAPAAKTEKSDSGASTYQKIGAASGIAGGVLNIFGTLQEASEAMEDLDYRAKRKDKNALLLQREADFVLGNVEILKREGEQTVRLQRSLARKEIGATMAAYGASGVTLEGSPLEVLHESFANAEMDTKRIRDATDYKVRAYRRYIDQLKERVNAEREDAQRLRKQMGDVSARETLGLLGGALQIGAGIGKLVAGG